MPNSALPRSTNIQCCALMHAYKFLWKRAQTDLVFYVRVYKSVYCPKNAFSPISGIYAQLGSTALYQYTMLRADARLQISVETSSNGPSFLRSCVQECILSKKRIFANFWYLCPTRLYRALPIYNVAR